MQVNDELRVLVEAEVARAIENFEKLGKGIGGAEKEAKSLGDAIDSVSRKAMLISTALGGAGIAAVKFAGENEKLKLSLKNMLGSADEAAAVFEQWRKLGNSPGLSADEVFDLGRAMVNMGHDAQYATKTIQMLGNVAAGAGKSFGTVSGAFEHVRSVGKMTARDLAGLQQQGIPILKQLAKELNASEEGARRMVAEGKVGFPELERAFRSLTGPGGQFAGMMDELSGAALEKFNAAVSDAKQALASFGEIMLPMAAELLDGASSMLRGINDMDDGAKRFVVGMGAVVAAAGPAIAAVKSIHAAMAAAAANPYMLAIAGVIAAAGIVAGVVNKQAHAYEDLNTKINKTKAESEGLLRSYADGNTAKTLDEETTRKLIGLYPSLSGEITAYATTVDEAARAVKRLTEAEITNAAEKQIETLKKQALAAEELAARYELMQAAAGASIEYLSDAMLNKAQWGAMVQKAGDTRRQVNAELAKIGKTLGDDFAVIDIPINVVIPDPASSGGQAEAAKKKWQEWFAEIAKIDPLRFGDSGAKAAELYLDGLGRSLKAGKTAFAQLGEDFDLAEALRSQQGDIQKALVDLFSIDPADINAQFTAADESIKALIADYKRLGEAAEEAEEAQKTAAGGKEYVQKIEELKQKIAGLGKSEVQLAYDMAVAKKASSEQAEEIARLTGEYQRKEIIAEYDRQIKELTASQRELAIAAYEATGATNAELAAFGEKFDELDLAQKSQRLKNTLDGVRNSIVNLGASAALSGFEEFGRALGEGEDAGESMRRALVAMSQEILNALPTLFLQAGLHLIAQGQWALGLGFVAASGSTALVKGYVNGRIESEREAAKANALGNVYDASGVRAFGHGGTFTNQIVQSPTTFRFARGAGLMGEAGPEAIVPLRRMANGSLGVQAAGSGANVTVNIINNSGAEVKQEERDDGAGGKEIIVVIGEMVNNHIASGKADRVISGRYGLQAQGV
jgi:tape measure domain-containing protein